MRCNKDHVFIVNGGHFVEKRTRSGEMIASICCRKCLRELEKAIAELKASKDTMK